MGDGDITHETPQVRGRRKPRTPCILNYTKEVRPQTEEDRDAMLFC